MSEWVIRPYDPETDEDVVLSTFISSYRSSEYGKRHGAHHRDTEPSRRFWDEHRSFFLEVIADSTVMVACDPGRVLQSDDGPPIIWGWIAYEGPVLHYVLVKRSAAQLGLAEEIFRDLLGDRVRSETAYTLEQVELGRMYAAAARAEEWPPGRPVEPVFPRELGRIVRLPRSWYADYTYFHRESAA